MKTKTLIYPLAFVLVISAGAGASFAQMNTNLGTNAGNSGNRNTSIGYEAGNVVTGDDNSFLGWNAGIGNTSGIKNSFFGSDAGRNTTTGSSNVFLGNQAGYINTTNSANTFIGANSGYWFNSGSSNVLIGWESGKNLGTGNSNVFLGTHSGGYATTGSFNVFLGYGAGRNENGSNKLYIDNSDTTTPLIYGDFSTDKLKINGYLGIQVDPLEALHLNGSIRGNINGALRISSGYGYVDVGAQGTSWAHFYTDRPRYFFNHGLTVDDGLIGSYNEDLNLQTSGTTRLTISNSNGYVGVGTTNPTNQFQIGPNPSGYTASDFVVSNSTGSFAIQNQPADTYLYGSRDISIRPAGAMAFYANTSGNVGIGTSAPASKLHVYNSGSTYMSLDKPSSTYEAGIQFSKAGSVQFYLYNDDSNDALKIQTTGLSGEADATPRMQFPKTNKDIYMAESGGNVAIGINSSSAKLDVVGPSTGSGVTIRAGGGGDVLLNSGGSLFFDGNYSYSSGNYIRPLSANTQAFFTSGVERLRISSTGLVGIGNIVPTEGLDVNGTGRFRNVPQDNSLTKLLVINSNGKVFWRESTAVTGDNLGNHTATQSIVPSSNGNFDLGSSANYFRSIYVEKNIHFGGTGMNTVVGNNSGNNLTGGANSFFGSSAGAASTSGSNNTFIGRQSGQQNITGSENTYLGAQSGMLSTANNNTCIGSSSGRSITTGASNLSLGYWAGYSLATGSNNVFIGPYAGWEETGSDKLYIDNSITSSNPLIYGDFNTNRVGINKVPNQTGSVFEVQNAYCDGSTWYNASDRNLKRNFRTIGNESILDNLMSLKIERWTYKADSLGADHIGPVSQDFNTVFKLGSNDKAISTVDEIGVALAAIQELNRKTQKLENLLNEQKYLISTLLTSNTVESVQKDSEPDGLELYQNTPNPFKSNTEIRMRIPVTVIEATLFVYDLQGKQINRILISERGNTAYTIEGGSLSAGMYLYTLFADDQIVGVKRMILTE